MQGANHPSETTGEVSGTSGGTTGAPEAFCRVRERICSAALLLILLAYTFIIVFSMAAEALLLHIAVASPAHSATRLGNGIYRSTAKIWGRASFRRPNHIPLPKGSRTLLPCDSPLCVLPFHSGAHIPVVSKMFTPWTAVSRLQAPAAAAITGTPEKAQSLLELLLAKAAAARA
jgi:hypothetical protein